MFARALREWVIFAAFVSLVFAGQYVPANIRSDKFSGIDYKSKYFNGLVRRSGGVIANFSYILTEKFRFLGYPSVVAIFGANKRRRGTLFPRGEE